MTRKRNNTFKLLTSIAIVAVMSFSLLIAALADEYPFYSEGSSADNPAKAAITKVFKVPVNTKVPQSTFTFTFDKVGVNGKTDKADMPGIPDISIGIAASATSFPHPTEPGTWLVIKESGDFLKNPTAPVWEKVGIHKYTVTEVQSGIVFFNNGGKEEEYYSKAEYEIDIWVDRDSNGNLYAKYVYGIIVPGTETVDEWYEGYDPNKPKVDPTPGTSTSLEYDTINGKFSQVVFTNKYWKTDGGGTTDPTKGALEISKTVDGLRDESELLGDVYFTFEVIVTQPSVVKDPQTYNAYIFDSSGNKVTDAKNYGSYGADGLITVASGSPLTVKLTDGQKLVFVDLHVGSKVEVWEVKDPANDDFTPTYLRSFAGDKTAKTGDYQDARWGFPRATGDPADPGPHYLEEKPNHNKVDFTNTRTGSTPTGLDVNDLPYFLLIGVAAAGLVGYVALKYRRRAKRGV